MNQVSATTKAALSINWQRGVLVLILVAAFAKTSVAQFDVINSTNPPYDPQRLIEDVFLGDGVEVLNIQYDGQAEALGYFTEETGPIGFSEGIVLTTGHAATDPSGVGTNEPASANAQVGNMSAVRDNNLEAIVPYLKSDGTQNIHDVARYTITFIPKGDKVKFRYVFASEEYPEFVCSDYNDIFGFFIDGPGFSGPYERGGVNLAVVPGTNLPVTINSINPGTHGTSGSPTGCGPPDGSLANSAYYVDNAGAAYPVYDGMTTILTAEADVTPCQTYTIQITLGDVGDGVFDSGVFLEAKSFSTPVFLVDVETITLSGDVAEGCMPALLNFEASEPAAVDRIVPYTVTGTATPGVDYDALPGVITIPAGVTEVSVPITAYVDGITESPESIIIEVATDLCSTKIVSLDIIDRAIPPVPLLLDTVICPGASVDLDATLPKAVDSETTFTNSVPAFISPVDVPTYRDITVTGIQPLELRRGLIARVCVDLVHNKMEDLDLFLFGPNGNYLELSTDNGGSGPGNFSSGCFTSNSLIEITDPAAGPVFDGDYLPEGDWTGLWNDDINFVNGNWQLQIIDDENGGSGVFSGWSITFEPVYSIDYEWSPAAGLSCTDCPDPTATITSNTMYTITAEDSYGCVETSSVQISHAPATVAPTMSCVSGYDNLVFNWNIDSGVLRYEVNIDNGGWVNVGLVQTDTLRGLGVNQTVNFQVRAVGECDSAESSTSCTTQNCSPYTPTAVPQDAQCFGASDGEVALTPNGGLAPHTYTVGSFSNTTGVFSGLVAGNYTAGVVDANGCGGSTTFTIGEPAAIATSVSIVNPSTCGDPFVATATGASSAGGPYTYDWTGALAGDVQSFSVSGTYYVTITDNAMCTALDSAVIVVPPTLSASFGLTEISCGGIDDGELTVSTSNGNGTIEYGLDNVYGSVNTFSSLAPGTYVLSARDAFGCVVDTTITLVAPAPLTLLMGKTDVGCNGGVDGKAWAEVSGNRGAITYTWTGSTETSDTLRNLTSGKVYVTVMDAAGCSVTDSVELFESGPLSATLAADSVTCFGLSNGTLRANTFGGRAPYSFVWSTGVTTTDSVLTGLPAGPYSVVVTDFSGCSYGVSVNIEEPNILQVSHVNVPITCYNSPTAEIDLTVIGGTQPYQYAWLDGPIVEDRIQLAPDTYEVLVTDANGCSISHQIVVNNHQLALEVEVIPTAVTCFGRSDGSIKTNPSGGISPYFYEWTGPNGYAFFGRNPEQLIAGEYTLNLRDTYGCPFDTTFNVVESDSLILATSTTDSICYGANTGSLHVTVTGGTTPYQYLWDNGEAIDTAYMLTPGQHTVSVVDTNGCIATDTSFINSLPEISLELDQSGIVCYGDSNGTASITRVLYGGSPRTLSSMVYRWRHDSTETGTFVSGLGGRQEAVVFATDFRGCEASDSIVIAEPIPVSATVEILNDVNCWGGSDGTAEVSVFGGTPDYSYNWLSPVANPSDSIINDLPEGIHEVVAIDANGCVDTTSVTIRQPDSLIINFDLREVNCFALNTGFLGAEIRGGARPYLYHWSTGDIGTSIDSLTEGTYRLRIIDDNGCEATDTAFIHTASTVELAGESFGVSCNGDRDGAIELEATGGNGPYDYRISGYDYNIFSEFRYLDASNYYALAIDRDGCPSDTLYLEVEEPQPIIVEAGEEIELELGDSIQLFAEVFNGQGPIDYLWLPGDSTMFSCQSCPEPIISPTFQGVIQIQVIDSLGCESDDYVRIKLRKELQALVPTGFTPNNDGRDDLLLIHGKSGTEVISFKVFDRWGDVVFADGGYLVNDESRGWNGRVKNVYANGGVYIWEAQVKYLDGAIETLSGQSTLIR